MMYEPVIWEEMSDIVWMYISIAVLFVVWSIGAYAISRYYDNRIRNYPRR